LLHVLLIDINQLLVLITVIIIFYQGILLVLLGLLIDFWLWILV